jgi:hypothetical protein
MSSANFLKGNQAVFKFAESIMNLRSNLANFVYRILSLVMIYKYKLTCLRIFARLPPRASNFGLISVKYSDSATHMKITTYYKQKNP